MLSKHLGGYQEGANRKRWEGQRESQVRREASAFMSFQFSLPPKCLLREICCVALHCALNWPLCWICSEKKKETFGPGLSLDQTSMFHLSEEVCQKFSFWQNPGEKAAYPELHYWRLMTLAWSHFWRSPQLYTWSNSMSVIVKESKKSG